MWTRSARTGKLRRDLLARLACVLLLIPPVVREAASQPVNQTPAAALDPSTPQTLLLDGVRAFRAERFDEALALFRRVEATESPRDIGFYLGMTLHKLGRHAEALGAFRTARRSGMREPVADYYQAVSCYRLGLSERARQNFSTLITEPKDAGTTPAPVLGPRLKEGAQRFLQSIEQQRASAESTDKTAWSQRHFDEALARVDALLGAAQADIALEWLDEATQRWMQLANRADKVTLLRQRSARLRELLRGKPAEADVVAIEARLGSGGPN